MSEIELHFQDVFSGEEIEILLNDMVVAKRSMKTRFQTGLAHIEKLNVDLGDEIEVRVAGQSSGDSIKVLQNIYDYRITMSNASINIEASKDRLRYL